MLSNFLGIIMSASISFVPLAGAMTFDNALDVTKRGTVGDLGHKSTSVANQKSKVVRTEPVPFSVRYVEDIALPLGVEVIIQEGKDGEKTFYKSNDKNILKDTELPSSVVLYDSITIQPIEKVIRKGVNVEVIPGVSQKTLDLETGKKIEKIEKEEARKQEEQNIAENNERVKSSKNEESLIPNTSENKTNSHHSKESNTNRDTSSSSSQNNSNKSYHSGTKYDWMRAAGIAEKDFAHVDYIVTRESNWNPQAQNPTSSAFGLPQSLPGSKMASAGSDWKTNPVTQLKWMKSYVEDRYGNFANAVSHSRSKGWY